MMTPTGRAIALAGAGAPVSLLLAAAGAHELWIIGPVWAMGVGLLCLVDALLAPSAPPDAVKLDAPAVSAVGAGAFKVRTSISFAGRTPPQAHCLLETNELLAPVGAPAPALAEDSALSAETTLAPRRRGEARIANVHVRWRGPLGLAWRQIVDAVDRTIAITPDLEGVQRHAERLFSRTAMHGLKPLRDRGDGSEFDALTEFSPGMDRRLVEWKQSARHRALFAKEVRAERNHQLAFAIDTGRSMCEPINGAPRLDWSLNAALLLAYVALRLGDRVSFFGFDARPNLATGFVSGMRSFPHLMAQTAKLEYSSAETNYTLSLATLSEKLQRRSMVIVFTDFTDPVSAELMVDNLIRLNKKHLVVFVTFPDQELEALRQARLAATDDVSRAVIAQRLLQDREIVLTRLRRLGVQIVSAPLEELGPALVAVYDALRRRERV